MWSSSLAQGIASNHNVGGNGNGPLNSVITTKRQSSMTANLVPGDRVRFQLSEDEFSGKSPSPTSEFGVDEVAEEPVDEEELPGLSSKMRCIIIFFAFFDFLNRVMI